jgi:hypothetical protein
VLQNYIKAIQDIEKLIAETNKQLRFNIGEIIYKTREKEGYKNFKFERLAGVLQNFYPACVVSDYTLKRLYDSYFIKHTCPKWYFFKVLFSFVLLFVALILFCVLLSPIINKFFCIF